MKKKHLKVLKLEELNHYLKKNALPNEEKHVSDLLQFVCVQLLQYCIKKTQFKRET